MYLFSSGSTSYNHPKQIPDDVTLHKPEEHTKALQRLGRRERYLESVRLDKAKTEVIAKLCHRVKQIGATDTDMMLYKRGSKSYNPFAYATKSSDAFDGRLADYIIYFFEPNMRRVQDFRKALRGDARDTFYQRRETALRDEEAVKLFESYKEHVGATERISSVFLDCL